MIIGKLFLLMYLLFVTIGITHQILLRKAISNFQKDNYDHDILESKEWISTSSSFFTYVKDKKKFKILEKSNIVEEFRDMKKVIYLSKILSIFYVVLTVFTIFIILDIP